MKDSILLMDIYKRYLRITADLVTILERNMKKAINGGTGISPELKKKYNEFRKHAHRTIEDFNDNLHKLLKIDWELKEIEDKVKNDNNQVKQEGQQ